PRATSLVFGRTTRPPRPPANRRNHRPQNRPPSSATSQVSWATSSATARSRKYISAILMRGRGSVRPGSSNAPSPPERPSEHRASTPCDHIPGAADLCDALTVPLTGGAIADEVVERVASVGDLRDTAAACGRPEQVPPRPGARRGLAGSQERWPGSRA